jgi:hypothetical protein
MFWGALMGDYGEGFGFVEVEGLLVVVGDVWGLGV